nr:PREDICTED: vitellogenin-2-like [Linepithema humile]
MWFQLSLLLLFGAVLADQRDHRQAWNTRTQYQYLVQSRTLISLDNKNVTGIQFKGVLTVQTSSPDTLTALITKPQYAHVNTELSEGWETIIPDEMLQYRELPLSGLPFQIKLDEGVIQELLFAQNVPTWEVNFLKSVVSQLQVNLQKKNVLMDRETLLPNDELSLGTYRVMEASVGGKCEVLYDVKLAENQQTAMELDPMLNSDDTRQFIEVKKLKNYNNCKQQKDYSYGFDNKIKLKLKDEDNNKVTTKLSASRIVLYGNLKRFTIYSSVMRNNIYIKSTKNENIGTIHSQVILTLIELDEHHNTIHINPNKLRTAGNLVYTDGGPFLSQNHDSQSSSEENQSQNNNDQNSADNRNQRIEQSLPKLNEVPDSLVMPFFNNYKNQNINLSDQLNPVEAARQKILEIVDEMEQTDNLLFEETLEKYTILVNLLRILNVGQYDELKQRLDIGSQFQRLNNPDLDKHPLSDRQSIVWDILYDAVAQSGTGPALLAIANWLKNENDLNIPQMIQVLTQIPNAARAPTPEYVKTYFDLIIHPTIKNGNYVDRVAPVAFGELIFNGQLYLSKSSKIKNLGQDTTEIYIPYMEQELDRAVKTDNSPLVQTYITALGCIGHPKILSVFEPYLEGRKPVTRYERLLMVRWLYKLVVINPEELKNVLYKIYLNEKEAYEVRSMAVYLYFLSNPSLTALTRMAKFTNYDKSEQVNSAVKSGIISLSKVNRPDLHLLIENARIARKLLTPKNYDLTYSQIHFTEKSIVATIGSKDSDMPQMAIFDANNFYDPQQPVILAEYALSNVDNLMNLFQKQERQERKNSPVEKLVEMFNIKLEESKKLKGNVFFSALYGKVFYPFDKQDVMTLLRWLISGNPNVNFHQLYIRDRITSSVTESGLQLTYTEELPTLAKMHVTKNTDIEAENIGVKVYGKLNAVVSGKIQHRLGFLLAFERQQYQTGVDTKWQVHLPVEYENKGKLTEENVYSYELKLRPVSQSQNAQIRLLHYSTVSFNTRRADFDFQPVSSINVTNIINSPTQGSLSYRVGTIYVTAETNAKETLEKLNLASLIKTMFDKPDLLPYSQFDVYIDNKKETKNELSLKVDYKGQNMLIGHHVDKSQLPLISHLKSKISLEDITDKKPHSWERQNQILQEVSKDIKSANAHVYDVSLEIPSLLPRDRQVLTIGLGKSNVDSKSRVLFYWNHQSQKDEEIQSEALVTAELHSSSDLRVYRNFNEAMEQTPINEFMIDMLIGDRNKVTDKIQIEGNFTQSNSLREMIMNSKITRLCQQQMKQGNNKLLQCRQAIQNAQMKDNLKLSMNTNSERYKMYTDIALEYLSDIMPRKNVKLSNPKNIESNVDLEMKISPDYREAKILINTPKRNVVFGTSASSGGQFSLQKRSESNAGKSPLHCIIERSRASTFDGKYYDMNLGKTNWKVMVLPVSETELPEKMKLAAAVKRTKDEKIKMFLILGNHEITLQKLNGTFAVSIVERQEIMFPPHTTYMLQSEESELIAEIVDTSQNIIWVNAPTYGLFLSFSEYYVDIELSNKYRNKVRGLCGNYDRELKNDFLTPDNCIAEDARKFVAAYTLTNNMDSVEDILHKKWTTKNSNCSKEHYILTDVISDREAGRLTSKPMWGYHQNLAENLNDKNAQKNLQKVVNRTKIEEDDQQICFSLEPVPACPENSEPVKTELKEIGFHCMPKLEAALELKRRIQQGANPNMSHRSLSMKQNRQVPTVCRATNFGAVIADQTDLRHAWQTGTQYRYLIQSRTLVNLNNNKNVSGIQLKSAFIVQPSSPDTLQAMLIKPQYAHVNTELSELGWDTNIPNDLLQYHNLPLSGKPFQIKLKRGVIRELLVEHDVPTWEVNLLKSIVTQLQIDIRDKNAKMDRKTEILSKEEPSITHKVIEDSVGGRCEVLYDIKLLEKNTLERPPMLDSNNEDQLIAIEKIKNYNKCEQQRGYHHGFSGKASLKPTHDDNNKFVMKLSTSNILIFGNLKHFTIYSSVMQNNIHVKLSQNNDLGTVHSQTLLSLTDVDRDFDEISINLSKLKSTGSLMYTYHSSISDIEQSMLIKPHRSSFIRNSEHTQLTGDDRSQSSSEENRSQTNSGSSSTANSSNEKLKRLQSRLDIALQNPMMPSFMGYGNRNMQMSDELNPVKIANVKIAQITDDLQEPNNQPYYETLDKYMILVNLLRAFNIQQYAELEERLNRMQLSENSPLNNRHMNSKQNDLWNVYYDAVAQAGTGPALLTIANWLKNENLNTAQMIQAILQIPIAARTPTPEYVKAFFDLISDPKVTQQEHLNRIAPMAFSDLVFNAQVNKKNSEHVYPIYSFGKMAPQNDNDLLDIYIPYMEMQLKQAIKDGNGPLTQTYIVALGNLGHPRILSVFEPYLEGQKPVSTYQRMLMVMTLYRLRLTNERLIKNVLYKIYLNEQEAYEVRCAAVYLYMLSNPSTVTLLRMAKYTNSDKSHEVNSAVRSSIESLANLKGLKFKRIASKARIARQLLSSNYDYTFSHGYLKHKIIMKTIGSDDSNIPKYVFFNKDRSHSRLSQSILTAEYAVSSMKQLYEIFKEREKNQMQSQVEKLVERLNIQDKELEKLEGNILLSTIYGKILYPFDNQDVEEFAKLLNEKNHRVNFKHMYSYDETLSFPTENGLPFSYTEEMPVLIRVHATKNNEVVEKSTKMSGEINMVMANKMQRKFGFQVPFERQQYLAGVDTNLQMYLPLAYEQRITETGQNSQNYELKLRPIQSQEGSPIKMAHLSTVPFSTRHNNYDFESSVSKNTHVHNSKKERKLSYQIGTIHVTGEITAEPNEWQAMNLADQLKKMFNEPALQYNRFDVYMNNDMELNNEINLNVRYEQQEMNDDQVGRQSESEIDKIEIVDGNPNSQARRKQILQEISKDMKSVKARVYDINFEIPSLLPQDRQILTIGVGKSNMDLKSRVLVYWNLQSLKDGKIKSEALSTGKMQSTQKMYLSFDEAMQNTPKDEFMLDTLIGDNYRKGEKIQIKGNFMQSNAMKELIMNLRTTRQCQQEMKQGNKQGWLPQCQEAIRQIAQIKDHLKISMNMDSEHYNMLANTALNYISKNMLSANMNLVNPQNAGKKTVDLEMKISPNYRKAKVLVKSSKMDLALSLPDSSEAQSSSARLNEIDDMANSGPQKLQSLSIDSCSVSENGVYTFDGHYYSINLSKSWIVLVAPKFRGTNLSKSKIWKEIQVGFLARKQNDNIEFRILLRRQGVILKKQNGDLLLTDDDGKIISFPPGTNYKLVESETTLATLQHINDYIMMLSDILEISALYNGKTISISASSKYRTAISGLCGNYDRQANNDFITPSNCMMQKSDEFIATYSLTDNDQSVQNREKVNRSNCIKLTHQQTDVINNKKAERLTMGTWGHHLNKNQAENLNNRNAQENLQEIIKRTKVEEDDQQICFSLEPVPACPENSEPMKTKLKEIGFHCMPKIEAAHELKRRIQQGANPNMSHKSLSMKQIRQVPTVCKATN